MPGTSTGRGARRRWAGVLVALLATVLWVRAEVVAPVRVGSDSMAPTVCAGDRLLLWRPGTVGRGDLVVFEDPVELVPTLKRVVAVAGQTVEFRDAVLHVDGVAVREPYVDLESVDGLYLGPVVVGPAALYVLGDAREASIDSRVYGPVPQSAVRGRVVTRWWSACPDHGSP